MGSGEVNRDDIIRMAGHREVPPWAMKLVQDCVDAEREACAMVCDDNAATMPKSENAEACQDCAYIIRARGEQ